MYARCAPKPDGIVFTDSVQISGHPEVGLERRAEKGNSVTVLRLDGAGHFDGFATDRQHGKPAIADILALLK